MAQTVALKLYEVITALNRTDASDSGEYNFYVHSGSRMLVSVLVKDIDPGATLQVFVENAFDQDEPYDTLDIIEASSAGLMKRVYSDFNNQFKIRYAVSNGAASFKVGIALFDNAGTTKIEGAQLSVDLSAVADGEGRFDSVRIGDGTDLLAINPDGSLTIVIEDPQDEEAVSQYDESPGVPSGVDTTVLTYVVPVDKEAYLFRVEGSGENVARYQVTVNDDVIATRRTHHGSGLSTEFTFLTLSKKPVVLQAGDVLKINVKHNRPDAGDFEARVQLVLKDA